ncbi:unnamed protein product [Spirodela intermedia]|uniref:Uncharacterized protein n=2 Tax=Spirodela intermedia TaxID=51605 RepID=A0A7I8IKA6_SPIIN|nr:unnamed protein product [Spirodela intermedia]CAA6657803.1 unnamed protein product [Spirodela intermedia]CAA7393924.1 unnamed protein product [Spirodela intermedia]
MDSRKASWILEFVLRQPVEDWLAKVVLLHLPIPLVLDPRLKKILLLRRLWSDLSVGKLSCETLRSLELLEELDRSLDAGETSEALMAAYSAAAAELTAAPLRSGRQANFFECVNRIWNCRVADLEQSEARGMMGEGLRQWRKRMEEAVVSDDAKDWVLQRDTSGEAMAALREYLRVALEEMGPPQLELAARLLDDKPGTSGQRDKEVLLAGKTDRQNQDAASDGLLPSAMPEINKLKEALKSSCADLRKAVQDPFPEALRKAAEVQNAMLENSPDPVDEKKSSSRTDEEKDADDCLPDAAVCATMQRSSHPGAAKNVIRPIEPVNDVLFSSSAQWDEDSIESLSDISPPNSAKRRQLPPPRNRRVSPLKLQEMRKFVRRRKIKRWTPQEEDTLREAVKKHGTGNWKLILLCYPGDLEGRTEIDLKDKWRNLTR